MSSGHEKLSRLFLELLKLDRRERDARLSEVQRISPQLAAEVESMLRHDAAPPAVLKTGARGCPETAAPESIGPYRVISVLGRGGMGEVFLAEQVEPLKRRVAIKIVRAGMGSASAMMRFEIERQVLARLGHPNVARIFDAGTTESGLPYFAMEVVNGPSITEYCDRGKLPVRDRLELFLEVCAGVHHAHQNAILHRDLKPSNVLVEMSGDRVIPKVIDFGVAKAIDPAPSASGGSQTHTGQFLGTPSYMSPEQVSSIPRGVDVRSDVYSLGAILYELLCGAPPLDLARVDPLDFVEIQRRVRQSTPPPPSARIASQPPEMAALRSSSPERLRRTLRGDLDSVVLKALERDPADRYGSVPELGDDLRRYLGHEPVRAASTGWVSRFRKGVRRNRIGASFALLLMVVAIVTSTLAWRLNRARAEAEQASRNAEDYARLLLAGYEVTGPSGIRPEIPDPSWFLKRAARNAVTLPVAPETRVRLLRAVGDAHVHALKLDDGRELLDMALDEYSRLGPDAPALWGLEISESFAFLAIQEGRWDESEAILRNVIDRTGGSDRGASSLRAEARRDLIRLLNATDRVAEALDEIRHLLDHLSSELGPRDPETLIAQSYLATVELNNGMHRQSADRLRTLIPVMEDVLGPRHPEVLIAFYNLSCDLAMLGKTEESLALLTLSVDRGLAIVHNLFADTDLASLHDDPRFHEVAQRQVLNATVSVNRLSSWVPLYARLGNVDKAAGLASDLRDASRRVFGPDHQNTREATYRAAEMDIIAGGYAKGETVMRSLLAEYHPDPEVPPVDPIYVANLHWSLAECLMGLDRREEALRTLKQAERFFVMGGKDVEQSVLYARAGQCVVRRDREGALQLLREVFRLHPTSELTPERDVIFQELHDDPEFRALLRAERHPYVIF